MSFVTDQTMNLRTFVEALDDRSIESLFLPEHTHIPISRRSPFPPGGELPEHYKRTVDPFVGLAMAAAWSQRLRIGTAVCLVAQRDPIVLAKEISTLDRLSSGRFLFGVGFGWNREEAENHGVRAPQRRDVAIDRLRLMKRLWTEETPSYSGEVTMSPSWQWPKPHQSPHPPIFLGAEASKRTFDRVIRVANGWFPLSGGRRLKEHMVLLRSMAEDAGRDPKEIRVMAGLRRPDTEILDAYAEAGVERAVLGLPPGNEGTVLPVLDRYATLVRRYA